MGGWGKPLAEIWTNNVPPSRPSCSELCVYTQYLREVQKKITHPAKLLVLGSTPEFRDWGFQENLEINVVDKSRDYYEQISREIRHKNLKEKVFYYEWEEMHLPEKYDIIVGDLAIGNIDPLRFDSFLDCIRNSLSDEGYFMGKSLIWPIGQKPKTPKQIVSEYSKTKHIHPYTYINHQVAMYCLDRDRFLLDFQKMFQELNTLVENGDMDRDVFAFFTNVGWNTEMKFEFFSPSQDYFIEHVEKFLSFKQFIHTEDMYTQIFPIYIITK